MKTIILDDKYEQTCSGWQSVEIAVELGDVRLIDGALHYAGAVYSKRWSKKKDVLWWRVKD